MQTRAASVTSINLYTQDHIVKYEWKVPTVTIASHASHAWCATSSLQIRSLPRNTLFHSHHSTKVNKGDSSLTTPQLVCEVLVHFMPRAMAIIIMFLCKQSSAVALAVSQHTSRTTSKCTFTQQPNKAGQMELPYSCVQCTCAR